MSDQPPAVRTPTDRLIDRLENYYDFACEGGPLRNCADWQQLKAAIQVPAPDPSVGTPRPITAPPCEHYSRSLKENTDARSEVRAATGTAASGFSPQEAPRRISADDMAELNRQISDYKARCDRGETVSGSDARWLLNEMIYAYDHSAVGTPQWKPIESAPKDGTWVLLGWFELPGMDSQKIGFWHGIEKRWCDVHQVLHNEQSPPTHWMPRPDPLLVSGKQEEPTKEDDDSGARMQTGTPTDSLTASANEPQAKS